MSVTCEKLPDVDAPVNDIMMMVDDATFFHLSRHDIVISLQDEMVEQLLEYMRKGTTLPPNQTTREVSGTSITDRD